MQPRLDKTRRYLQKVSPLPSFSLLSPHTMLQSLLSDVKPQQRHSSRKFQPGSIELKKKHLRRKLLRSMMDLIDFHSLGVATAWSFAALDLSVNQKMQPVIAAWHGTLEKDFNPKFAATVFTTILKTFDQDPDVQLLEAEDDLTCMVSATLSWYPETVAEMPNLCGRLTLVQKPWECMTELPQELVFVFSRDQQARNVRLHELLRLIEEYNRHAIYQMALTPAFLTQDEIALVCVKISEFMQLPTCRHEYSESIYSLDLSILLIHFIPYADDLHKNLIFTLLKKLRSKKLAQYVEAHLTAAFTSIAKAMVTVAPCVDTAQKKELVECLKWTRPKDDSKSFFALCTLKISGVLQPTELKAFEGEFAAVAPVYTWDEFIKNLQENLRMNLEKDWLKPKNMQHLIKLIQDDNITRQQADNLCDVILPYTNPVIPQIETSELIQFLIQHDFNRFSPDKQKYLYDLMSQRYLAHYYHAILLDQANDPQKILFLLRKLFAEKRVINDISDFIHKIYARERAGQEATVMMDALRDVLPGGVLKLTAGYMGMR